MFEGGKERRKNLMRAFFSNWKNEKKVSKSKL